MCVCVCVCVCFWGEVNTVLKDQGRKKTDTNAFHQWRKWEKVTSVYVCMWLPLSVLVCMNVLVYFDKPLHCPVSVYRHPCLAGFSYAICRNLYVSHFLMQLCDFDHTHTHTHTHECKWLFRCSSQACVYVRMHSCTYTLWVKQDELGLECVICNKWLTLKLQVPAVLNVSLSGPIKAKLN